MERTRILAFADLHADKKLLLSLKERAHKENVDLVLICGDFTDYNEEAPRGLVQHFLDIGKPVAIMSGNHESSITSAIIADVYNIKHLHGQGFEHKHIGVFGAGGANVGPHHTDEDDLWNLLHKGHNQIKHKLKKLMVTHVHPSESSMEMGMFPGSESVRRAIEEFKPDILVCGHIHEAEGIEEVIGQTRVINVSRSGRVIEL